MVHGCSAFWIPFGTKLSVRTEITLLRHTAPPVSNVVFSPAVRIFPSTLCNPQSSSRPMQQVLLLSNFCPFFHGNRFLEGVHKYVVKVYSQPSSDYSWGGTYSSTIGNVSSFVPSFIQPIPSPYWHMESLQSFDAFFPDGVDYAFLQIFI